MPRFGFSLLVNTPMDGSWSFCVDWALSHDDLHSTFAFGLLIPKFSFSFFFDFFFCSVSKYLSISDSFSFLFLAEPLFLSHFRFPLLIRFLSHLLHLMMMMITAYDALRGRAVGSFCEECCNSFLGFSRFLSLSVSLSLSSYYVLRLCVFL